MSTIVTSEHTEAAVIPAAADQLEQRQAGGLVSVRDYALALRGDRRGITTIEYVIGIVAGITLVGVLILALTNPAVQHALVDLLTHIFGLGGTVKVGKHK